MRCLSLVVPLILPACGPTAHVYPSRSGRPALACEGDTGACDALFLHDVPFGRHDSATVTLRNIGHGPMHVTTSTSDPAFTVAPLEAWIDAEAAHDLVVTYTPTSFDPLAATLEVLHEASGSPLALALDGTTDDDADDDGYRHDAAPGGDDCNDFNPGIHPHADDDEGDGIDQDCDGQDG